MEAKFINGSTVTRIWSDTATELLAAFQYESDAFRFAEFKAMDDTRPDTVRYLVYCHLDGCSRVVAPKTQKAT